MPQRTLGRDRSNRRVGMRSEGGPGAAERQCRGGSDSASGGHVCPARVARAGGARLTAPPAAMAEALIRRAKSRPGGRRAARPRGHFTARQHGVRRAAQMLGHGIATAPLRCIPATRQLWLPPALSLRGVPRVRKTPEPATGEPQFYAKRCLTDGGHSWVCCCSGRSVWLLRTVLARGGHHLRRDVGRRVCGLGRRGSSPVARNFGNLPRPTLKR